MIVIDTETARFNYRVAGVCLDDGHVPLNRGTSDDFWYLPGGRCEFLESSSETLRREMREEIATDVRVGRLLWIVENFFPDDGRRWHELALSYEMSLPPGSRYLAKDRLHDGTEEGGPDLILSWFPVAALGTIRLFPSFLRTALAQPPAVPQHLIHRDRDA